MQQNRSLYTNRSNFNSRVSLISLKETEDYLQFDSKYLKQMALLIKQEAHFKIKRKHLIIPS